MTPELSVCDDESDPRIALLGAALGTFNDDSVGPSNRTTLAVFMEDEADQLLAGMYGMTAWGWLYVRWLWVDAANRGQGIAGELLARAELVAMQRGCRAAHIDTFSEQTRHVYEKAGYTVFGSLPDFVSGHTRWFLAKRWDTGTRTD